MAIRNDGNTDAQAAADERLALQEALDREREARHASKVEYRRLKDAYDELQARLVSGEGSYYLSGAAKKLDIVALPGFGPIAAQVRSDGRVGMHFDRLYTLWQAAQQAPADRPIVEVGTYRGGSAKFLAESFAARGMAPRFYVCDTFSGHARVDPVLDTAKHRDGSKFRDTSAEDVRDYLTAYSNVNLVVGDIIETAPVHLAGVPEFALVHIDVDVYPPTEFCLRFFAPRLARGAWIVIDDYGFRTCPGAKKAVDDFVAAHPAFSLLHLLSGQAVLFRAA
jgi:predicted O-methyltransferase YrrM